MNSSTMMNNLSLSSLYSRLSAEKSYLERTVKLIIHEGNFLHDERLREDGEMNVVRNWIKLGIEIPDAQLFLLLVAEKNKKSKSLRSQILEIQEKRANEGEMTEIDFSAILKNIEALECRENDEYERNKNEQSLINNDFFAIERVTKNNIEEETSDYNDWDRGVAGMFIAMHQQFEQSWVETPCAEYSRWHIADILKERAKSGDNRPHNYTETFLNIDALQRRELEEYHRHKKEEEMLQKDSLAIKREIYSLANLLFEDEQIIATGTGLPDDDVNMLENDGYTGCEEVD